MATLEIDQTWAFTSSGAGTAINCLGSVTQAACWGVSNGTSTATFALQSAISSGGPWATEGSTTLSTSGAAVFRVAGPFAWVRPYMTAMSTGGVTVRFIGVA